MIVLSAGEMTAQKFKVESFKKLSNDISAFVNPVMDLNDDGCALIKVQGSADFAFSTPLGIVKREDKVGEIWLYIPRGSKKITLKHPQWGVLRDYMFPSKIESLITYEIVIDEPHVQQTVADTVSPITVITRDTLIVTRLDTLIISEPQKNIPFSTDILVSSGFGSTSKTMMAGIMITAMKRHGAFLHFLTDFGSYKNPSASCERYGEINDHTPYYSGQKLHGCMIINGGAIHHISDMVSIFEGFGFGFNNTLWQLAESEGGGYVRNSYYSHRGFSFETGITVSFKRIVASASVISIKGTQWYGSLGFGIRLGK